MGNALPISHFGIEEGTGAVPSHMTWKSLASATLYDSRATLMTGQMSQTSHWLSSKFEPAQSWWERTRVHESWWELAVKRERELRLSSTLTDPRLIRAYSYFHKTRAARTSNLKFRQTHSLSNSRLTNNSHQVSCTLMHSHQLWVCSNFDESQWEVWLVWPVMRVARES